MTPVGEFTRVTSLRPWGDRERQHVIVWVDVARPDAETLLQESVNGIVKDAIQGTTLVGFMESL